MNSYILCLLTFKISQHVAIHSVYSSRDYFRNTPSMMYPVLWLNEVNNIFSQNSTNLKIVIMKKMK